MKFTIVTTPIHDAFGITTELSPVITDKAEMIASVDLASFISDVDTLAVVLYTSHPSILASHVYLPSDDVGRLALEKALDWHTSPECIQSLSSQDFFTLQLRKLLAIAKADDLHGAKLVPVFVSFLEKSSQYHLARTIIDDLQRFLFFKNYTDGFLLLEQAEDECVIMPSYLPRR